MIYVSSSCIKASKISQAVEELAVLGYKNIELSGGTKYYDTITDDLLELKEKYSLNYLCHNYFPPPQDPFVLNLASLDDSVRKLTSDHINKAIALSKVLGADKYSFHAGFLINIPLQQIGKKIEELPLFNRDEAFHVFCEEFRKLSKAGIKLYLENNVLSRENFNSFHGTNPFFITGFSDYQVHAGKISFAPLLDVAHLKVSCNTLNSSFEKEMELFMPLTDYIHISDNNGLADTNETFKKNSSLFEELRKHDFKTKTITLEVYSGLIGLEESYKTTLELLK